MIGLRGLCVGLDGTRTRYVAASAADTCVLYCPQKPEGSRIERGEGDPSDENAYDTRRDFCLEWTAVRLSVILDPRIRGPLQRLPPLQVPPPPEVYPVTNGIQAPHVYIFRF